MAQVSPNLTTALIGCSMLAAAGASMSPSYAARTFAPYSETRDITSPWSHSVGQHVVDTVVDFGGMITELRDKGLPVSVIADLMRVERKTVYAWLGSSHPRQDAQDRLAEIYPLIRDAFGGRYKTMHRLWRLKAADGVTLEGLCGAEKIDLDAVKRHLNGFEQSIRRYAMQDLQRKPINGGLNPLIEDFPIADVDSL